MKNFGFRLLFVLLCATVYTYASEAKGYKIVLASFPTFAEAKQALDSVGENITEKDRSLQSQYHFEIVARPSGKAFMLAIEPIKTQKEADTVVKQFKRLYPDAYINGYFGPTKGSVFLKPSIKPDPVAANITAEANTTVETDRMQTPVIAEKNVTAPIVEKALEEKTADNQDAPKSDRSFYILAIGIMIIGYLIFWIRSRKKRTISEDTAKDHLPEDLVEMIEAEAETEEDDSTILPEPTVSIPKVFESERDIFYKLKKNIFFMTLLGELKAAADLKDESRCRDLMNEILRYQKNFRQSVVIASMVGLIENKMFDRLSDFIANETD